MAHTNGLESVWAVLKRGYNGVYHNWSTKHMRRNVSEFVFRFNEGNVRNHTLVRLNHIISKSVGKRLTYEDLTRKAKTPFFNPSGGGSRGPLSS